MPSPGLAAAGLATVTHMHYRIEASPTRHGFSRVNFPGRVVVLEATGHEGTLWQVEVSAADGGGEGSVSVRAASAGDAVWQVAQATVRAVAQLTDGALVGEITAGPADPPP